MSAIVDIAVAVTAALNAGTFDVPIIAERAHVPEVDLADLERGGLRVLVAPSAASIEPWSRGKNAYDVAIDIGVVKKLASRGVEEIDILLAVVEQIQTLLRQVLTIGDDFAGWQSTACDPIFSRQHLQEQGIFFAVTTIRYRTAR